MNIKSSFLILFFLTSFHNLSQAQFSVNHWETVVFADNNWSYQLGDEEPPAFWMQPEFDDSNWSVAPGGFGYGDGDDFTVIPPTISLYIRIDFDLVDTSKIDLAVLHADYDDAFVAYINGVEFARGNFGTAGIPPAHDEIPPTDHEAALYTGGLPEAFPIYTDNINDQLIEGQNTLAIQIHNYLITSSDFSSNFYFSLGINDTSADYVPVPSWFFEPFIGTHLPLVKINTNDQEIVDEPRIVADLQVIDNGPGNLNFISDPANDYSGNIAIEIRGASSQSFPKNNFGFETQNAVGENNDYPLLGMPAENDWILHGPYSDKSLIRNALTFDIGRSMMDYASRTRFCELLINNEYRGVYLLMERIKRDESRVDISNLKPEDIEGDELTGGYIFQIDRDNPDTDEDGWYSNYGSNPFYAFHSPDDDDLLPVQKDYIINWMNEFEQAMIQSNYTSTYENYLDIESFIDYFLINELTKHIDAFKLSFYMYKRKDSNGGKLHMGPIWDFNLGYSNFNFGCEPEPEGWIYPCTNRAFWLDRILLLSEVRNQMHCRWEALRESTLQTETLISKIDSMVAEIGDASGRNFSKWNVIGVEVWPNYYVGDTYEEEVDFLKDWLRDRLEWMDQNMFGSADDCFTSNNALSNDFSIETYPNPFKEEVQFIFKSDASEKGTLRIFNALGQQVLEQDINNQEFFIWNTAGLNNGVYFFEISLDNQVVTGKVFKSGS